MDSSSRLDTTATATPAEGSPGAGGPLSPAAVLPELRRMLLVDLKLGLDEAALRADVPLLEGGLGLDSITLFELITLVERRYGLSFPPEKMTSETFCSLDAVAALVVQMQAGGQP